MTAERECPTCGRTSVGTATFISRTEYDWECPNCGAVEFFNLAEDREKERDE